MYYYSHQPYKTKKKLPDYKEWQVNTAAQCYLGHVYSIIFIQVDQLKQQVDQLKEQIALQDQRELSEVSAYLSPCTGTPQIVKLVVFCRQQR